MITCWVGRTCTHIAQAAAGQSDGRRRKGKGGDRLNDASTLPCERQLDPHAPQGYCRGPADFKAPGGGRDQMSFRANVLPCQWPPGLEFCEKHVRSTYVWWPVFFRQILRRKNRLGPGRGFIERRHHRGRRGGALSCVARYRLRGGRRRHRGSRKA